jgi:hypothetical protein
MQIANSTQFGSSKLIGPVHHEAQEAAVYFVFAFPIKHVTILMLKAQVRLFLEIKLIVSGKKVSKNITPGSVVGSMEAGQNVTCPCPLNPGSGFP